MRARHAVLACLLALTVFPARAVADPVSITSGFFSVTGIGASASFHIVANDLTATGSLEPGVTWPDLTCFPCAAGEVIRLDTEFLASSGFGTATVGETTFPRVNFGATDFLFGAPSVMAPDAAGDFTVTRSFSFSGRLLGADDINQPQPTVYFNELLIGQGLLTASFLATPNPGGPPLFSFRSIRYDFSAPEPVPEPGTLLLAATGLGAALGYRRRRTTRTGSASSAPSGI